MGRRTIASVCALLCAASLALVRIQSGSTSIEHLM